MSDLELEKMEYGCYLIEMLSWQLEDLVDFDFMTFEEFCKKGSDLINAY